jgi:omega-6 fatty acid desaturase (delta-12 desaturase)
MRDAPRSAKDIVPTNGNLDPHTLVRQLLRYRDPSRLRSIYELSLTAGLFALFWLAMWISLGVGYWFTLVLAVPAAGFLVRLFMIQHDCGHGAFLRSRSANDWIGRALGIFTFTPYDYWKRNHAIHHSTSGNLDRRGIGDILTLTVGEYLSRSPLGRFGYCLYRHPLVMFGIGPAYLFFLEHRLPLQQMRDGWRPWLSAIATNIGIATLAGLMIWQIGMEPFLLIQMPIMLLAASVGVWLFYVQHQFENVVWNRSESWKLHEAALHGSSHYDLPAILRWFTANIGIHHVHHLSSRIPFYRLPQVLRDFPRLRDVARVTVSQSVRSIGLALWDETKQKLVSFGEAATPLVRELRTGSATEV